MKHINIHEILAKAAKTQKELFEKVSLKKPINTKVD